MDVLTGLMFIQNVIGDVMKITLFIIMNGYNPMMAIMSKFLGFDEGSFRDMRVMMTTWAVVMGFWRMATRFGILFMIDCFLVFAQSNWEDNAY